MSRVARVVTAEPGRMVVGGAGVVAVGVAPLEVGVAAGVVTGTGGVLDVDEAAATTDGDVPAVPWPRESAAAGPHAARTSTVNSAPAAAGQWRSGGRIMRRGRHFRSARVQRGNARSDETTVGSEQDNPAQ